MSYKRILTIQDISCIGQCSLTVALPIISACGVETCILPSAVLSTHTGGFTDFTFRDLTDDMPKIAAHWKKQGIGFDAVYTGYLGNIKQIDIVLDIMKAFASRNSLNIVDPAMADNGKLYAGFDGDFVCAMRRLCSNADIILPNITEACLLTGIEYRTDYDKAYTDMLISELHKLCRGTVILTGACCNCEATGVAVSGSGAAEYYMHKRIDGNCHGTGDIYSSAFVGALMNGFSIADSARIAADFTLLCIEHTVGDTEHWYGAKFEQALPELIEILRSRKS